MSLNRPKVHRIPDHSGCSKQIVSILVVCADGSFVQCSLFTQADQACLTRSYRTDGRIVSSEDLCLI